MPSDIAVIVQARMGSTRLPGKVLADLGGQPMLLYQLCRLVYGLSAAAVPLGGMPHLVTALAATPDDHEQLAPILRRHGYAVSLPPVPPDDVLGRYATVARGLQAQWVVRLTGDCPLIDPAVVVWALQAAHTLNADYCSLTADWPDGLDVEVFTADALRLADQEAHDAADREHVTPFIWRHPARFALAHLPCPYALGAERWSVDTEQDLGFVRAVVREMQRRYGGQLYGWQDVWALVKDMTWRPQGARNTAYLHQIGSPKTWEEERYGSTQPATV